VDSIDEQILDLLRHHGRMSVREVAGRVGLSTGPVSRRIAKLEEAGVIRGYVAVIDDGRSGALEAFTEVRLNGATESGELEEILKDVPEVQQYFTISGDPDALIHFRVKDADDLQRVVNDMRRSGKLAGTKTLIVLASWQREAGHL
jgi:Lrp/AsnC family leucine-responsive transcriptional regulator